MESVVVLPGKEAGRLGGREANKPPAQGEQQEPSYRAHLVQTAVSSVLSISPV